MRYAAIQAEKANYPVSVLCEVLEVARSGYYAWCRRPESPRAVENRRLSVEIRSIFKERRHRYGSPRITDDLRDRGRRIGRNRVARLMKLDRLKARPKRRFCVTTTSNHGLPVARNVVARKFTVAAPDRVWAGDVTYIPTADGWLFLAVLIDLHSRRVVGWSLGDRNDEALTLAALRMAIEHRRPRPGLVHHSDRGTTYASTEYQDVLQQNGLQVSMSRRGNCWDNAVVESFFSTLKTECPELSASLHRQHARRLVFEYIECFYNPVRKHSYLGYKSPTAFEDLATSA
jgi:putative transposase